MAGNSEVADKVIEIVCDKLSTSPDRVTMETSFVNDLSADSLDTVEFVMELEEQFDINIPEDDAEKIQTVGDAVAYIEKAIAAK
ncbi:MAG: acyl carrier protein [Planctomycetota bacterium]